jgi:hypothetical protein
MSIEFELDISDLRAAPDFARADLTLYGLDHSGPSYQILVYLNPPGESEDAESAGYAGAVSVFGHGGCAGEEDHCQPRGPITVFDRRPPHQLVPTAKNLICTEAVREALPTADTLRVRLVPVIGSSPFVPPDLDPDSVLSVTEVALHTYL